MSVDVIWGIKMYLGLTVLKGLPVLLITHIASLSLCHEDKATLWIPKSNCPLKRLKLPRILPQPKRRLIDLMQLLGKIVPNGSQPQFFWKISQIRA